MVAKSIIFGDKFKIMKIIVILNDLFRKVKLLNVLLINKIDIFRITLIGVIIDIVIIRLIY